MISFLVDLAPSLLLVAGGCALAVWAKGLKDAQSALVSRLTRPPRDDMDDASRHGDASAPRPPRVPPN